MKKMVALVMTLLMVCAFATSAFAVVPCMRSGCFGGFINVYCAGEKSYDIETHTFYKPFWPFGATECKYVDEVHYSYGICDSCGYYYESGAALVQNHASIYGHDLECPDYDPDEIVLDCSYGDLLSWYL